MSFAAHILAFLKTLEFTVNLPADIGVMNPYEDEYAVNICQRFYNKYYNDDNRRSMIIGINPGRFGGGITGIPFTDPIRLQNDCGIDNAWAKKQELSSVYIYEMIKAFGGPSTFYNQFYITAISPLGFTRNNKNLNYYDDKMLQAGIREFAVSCLNRQVAFGIDTNAIFCLGDGKNYYYLSRLNKEYKFFKAVIPLPHPRFIMQYRLKRKTEYIQFYLKQLSEYGNS